MRAAAKRKKLARLLEKYERGAATPEEIAFLEAYDQQFDALPAVLETLSGEQIEAARVRLLEKVDRRIAQGEQAPVIPMRTRMLRRVAVAAALLILASSVYLYVSNRQKPVIATIAASSNSVPPGGNKAILTLASGATILLDSAHNGMLTQQGNATIIKTSSGQLAYQRTGESPAPRQGAELYNTLATPRGGQYQLTLPDGTTVWLNSASSIKYPVAFAGTERAVAITGEAYFEVAKDRSKPFRVTLGEMTVEVLGTHFNVNGFSDESAVRTTLLEGSVKIVKQGGSLLLKPREQAILKENGQMEKTADVDLDKVMSWKTGWFEFDQTDLPSILRQVSRWYDVDIVYEGRPKADQFGGRVSKNLPLSDILQSLEANGNGVRFRLEGKKLIVIP
jgi:transmembrane sensor